MSDITNIRWQTELAKKYGVYGFAIYHYWFNAQQKLLEKPAEIILKNKDIDIHYMFIWDNVSWKRTRSRIKGNDWSPVYDKKQIKIVHVTKEVVAKGMVFLQGLI